MAGGRIGCILLVLPPESAPGRKLQKPLKESDIFQSLAPLILFFLLKGRVKRRGGAWPNGPPKYASGQPLAFTASLLVQVRKSCLFLSIQLLLPGTQALKTHIHTKLMNIGAENGTFYNCTAVKLCNRILGELQIKASGLKNRNLQQCFKIPVSKFKHCFHRRSQKGPCPPP